jgi:CheY-like chemotaxis protein
MLLYGDEQNRADAAAYWINQGLEEGQLCIYASVHALDQSHMLGIPRLSAKIKNCQENISNKNLQIINFKPYFESALCGNLLLFEDLKTNLENMVYDLMMQGNKEGITVFADAACCLCESKSFEKSDILEKWWKDVHDEWLRNNYHITVICPHPELILKSKLDSKSKISDSHDLMIDLNEYDLHHLVTSSGQDNGTQILVVESDPDLMMLYAEFFDKRNITAVVTPEGNECLSVVKEKDFDIIILDTHLSGTIKASDLAKEIYRIKPNQRIVLTTTNPLYRTSIGIKSFGVSRKDVLIKPFRLSNLIKVIDSKPNSCTSFERN